MFAKTCVLCSLLIPAIAYYSMGAKSNYISNSESNDLDAQDQDLYPLNNVALQEKIVQYHNKFRTQVSPSASNMLYMSWSPEAALQAQRYAEQCLFLQHNPQEERVITDLGACGQNLYVSSEKVPWFNAIKDWFLEYRIFTYGSPHYNLHDVGHYTQMVWATSHKVGCGIAYCQGGQWGQFYNYVCHYCPGGNINPIVEFPYKPGKPCGDCPDHCYADLCTNACNQKDAYTNCHELVGLSGFCDSGNCNATCQCPTKLHKNYPWH